MATGLESFFVKCARMLQCRFYKGSGHFFVVRCAVNIENRVEEVINLMYKRYYPIKRRGHTRSSDG